MKLIFECYHLIGVHINVSVAEMFGVSLMKAFSEILRHP